MQNVYSAALFREGQKKRNYALFSQQPLQKKEIINGFIQKKNTQQNSQNKNKICKKGPEIPSISTNLRIRFQCVNKTYKQTVLDLKRKKKSCAATKIWTLRLKNKARKSLFYQSWRAKIKRNSSAILLIKSLAFYSFFIIL